MFDPFEYLVLRNRDGLLKTDFKERLGKEGLFNQENKHPIPTFPRRLAIVTSATGAAIHDILQILKRRFSSLEILLYPVRVQGDGAAAEIVGAIDDINRLALADVMIVGRGGGSLEDLWAFNEEIVARAVFRSKIPIISAVGHETDWTICDFAADLRAPTPSAAAEMVIASADELRGQVEGLQHRLRMMIESQLALWQATVERLRRSLHDPTMMLGHLSQRVDDLAERLNLALQRDMQRRQEHYTRMETALIHHSPSRQMDLLRQRVFLLSSQSERAMTLRLDGFREEFLGNAARLEVLSPLGTLLRGYSIATRLPDGKVITEVNCLAIGDRLLITLHRGKTSCVVESVEGVET